MMFQRLQIGELIFESVMDNIIAQGANQAGAYKLLPFEVHRITSGIGGGIMLPPAQAGMTVVIINHAGGTINVFGQLGDAIDDDASTLGVAQMTDSFVFFNCLTPGFWYTEGLASGYARGVGGQFATFATQANVTASATQSQAGGVPITAMNVQVSVSAVSGNALTLPISRAGMEITIVNNGANPIQVYGSASDSATVNGVAATVGVSQATSTVTIYFCFVAGAWWTK